MSNTRALARANARYWLGLAPFVHAQLARWRERAAALEDPRRRALALAKLEQERFNPQLAATLATQAPRTRRRDVAEAIVAAQVAYDYRDALGEHALEDEDEYTRELSEATCRIQQQLPGWPAVADVNRTAETRWSEAQCRGHAAIDGEDAPLREWAAREAAGTGLGWPEWLAGAQASVLAGHALVALAADDRATSEQAEALDRAYLSIGALTMLDSVIDRDRGTRGRELDYSRWYESYERMGERLAAAVREALDAVRLAPDGAHHEVTLTGIVAYYLSAPHARSPCARAVFAPVRRELGANLRPALAVMLAWRAAKRARSLSKRPPRRAWRLAAPLALLTASLAVGGSTVRTAQAATGAQADRHASASAADGERAHSARSMRASDVAHLRYVSASGSTLYETGRASGTLPGSMRVHMTIGPTFSGSFTIYASGGRIAGHGSATPHGVGVYESFAGSVTLTGGSGRFRHASGSAKLYGTFNRNTYALLIQTEGTLHY
jgi:tetraprenyl-beta-curcumene synthase